MIVNYSKSGKRSPMGANQKKNGATENEESHANKGEANNQTSLEANGESLEKETDKQ